MMAAMKKLGFTLSKADVEAGYLNCSEYQTESGCYQEFEYTPNEGSLLRVREVELSFVPEVHKTHVLIEIDRGLRSDGYVDLTIEHDQVNLSQICDQLEHLLS